MNINILRYPLFGIAGGQEVDLNFFKISYVYCIKNYNKQVEDPYIAAPYVTAPFCRLPYVAVPLWLRPYVVDRKILHVINHFACNLLAYFSK